MTAPRLTQEQSELALRFFRRGLNTLEIAVYFAKGDAQLARRVEAIVSNSILDLRDQMHKARTAA